MHIGNDGTLTTTTAIPGALFSVNARTEAAVTDLFCRNERLVCRFETDHGPLLVIHGDADSIIPFAAGQRVFARATTTNKTLAVLEGADERAREDLALASLLGGMCLANAGLGAVSQLCGLMFENALGVKLTAVPFQGTAPAMNADGVSAK